MCCLGRQPQGRWCARSMQATLASMLAQASLWRGLTQWLLRAAAARSLPCSLNAGSAGFYAGASHPVARAARVLPRRQLQCCCRARLTRAALASTLARATLCGARPSVCCLGRRLRGRCCACSTRTVLASTLARATLWRKAARVLLRAAAARSLPCSLDAGSAGFYAGASHPVARAARVLPRRQLQCCCRARLTRAALASTLARATLCGARPSVCCLGRRLRGRCCACSTRTVLASTLARATLWRKAARVLLRAAASGRCCARSTQATLASTLARATLWRGSLRLLPS